MTGPPSPPGLGGAVRRAWRAVSGERAVLTTFLVATAAMWAFIELADEVTEGATRSFDRAMLLALRVPTDVTDPLGPRWFEEVMRDLTALGGTGVLTLITLVATGYALLVGRRRLAATIALTVVGGVLISSLVKLGIDRPRPDLVPHGAPVTSASFPSGHAMMSATVYLTLAALLVPFARRAVKAYILGVALTVTTLVGVSRVYLGVHWPTDVVAGWAVGAAWALVVWTTAGVVHRRRGPSTDT